MAQLWWDGVVALAADCCPWSCLRCSEKQNVWGRNLKDHLILPLLPKGIYHRIRKSKNHRTLLCRPVFPRSHPSWCLGFLFVFVHNVLVHPHKPPSVFAWLPLCWDVLLQGSIPWHSTKETLEEAQVCYPEVQILLRALLVLARPGLPATCCLIPQTHTRMLEIPCEDQVVWMWRFCPQPFSLPGWATCSRPQF